MTTNTIDPVMPARWRELPNGGVIDQILRDVVRYPKIYDHCLWACLYREDYFWSDSIDNTRRSIPQDRWDAWIDLVDWIIDIPGSTGQREAARWAGLALIVWDSADQYLDMDPEQVAVAALLGVPAAVLMEPVVRARHEQRMILVDK